LVEFIANLLLCAALIPLWSAAGAATALSVALVLESILLFIMTKRRLNANCASSRLLSTGNRAATRSM
jgi:O-antigen/teichoic acid export membrane protein